jgi:hypothetical protein
MASLSSRIEFCDESDWQSSVIASNPLPTLNTGRQADGRAQDSPVFGGVEVGTRWQRQPVLLLDLLETGQPKQ